MKKKKIMTILLSVLPLLMVLAVYNKLPETVPMQWNSEGVSRYGNKQEYFMMAGLNLLLGLGMPFLAKIDPKRKNYERFRDIYDGMILLTLGFLTVIIGLTLAESLHPGMFNIPKVICSLVALLFILIGNWLPKVKQNFFLGVKTPWALSSETVWNKTQRMGGRMFFFGGILMLAGVFIVPEKLLFVLVVGLAAAICIIPTAMSYIWFQREMKNEN